MIAFAFAPLAIFFASPFWATQSFVHVDLVSTDAKRVQLVAPANNVVEDEARQFLANIGRIRQYCADNKLAFTSTVQNGLKLGQTTVKPVDVSQILKGNVGDNLTVNTCNFQVLENGKVVKTATFIFIYSQDEAKKWRLVEIEPM